VAQPAVRLADQREAQLIDAARAGDPEAFRQLTQPHYRQLHVHCTGCSGRSTTPRISSRRHSSGRGEVSTSTRAGRHFGHGSTRATNACLKEVERRPPRLPALDFGPKVDPALPPSAPVEEIVALDPYPDALLNEIEDRSPGPEAQYTLRESIELAFLTMIQVLPPRQRAVLLLRDVLGWRAAEVGLSSTARLRNVRPCSPNGI
jgi:hypothetical protein